MTIGYNAPKRMTLAVSLLSSVVLLNPGAAAQAQTSSPPSATATRPAKTPPEQTSVPNASPPASTTQTGVVDNLIKCGSTEQLAEELEAKKLGEFSVKVKNYLQSRLPAS